MPALIMQRRGDRLLHPSTGRDLAAAMPIARYVELPGDDHFAFVGDPAPIRVELRRLVREILEREAEEAEIEGSRP
ncbi:MAG: hypothetical protein QM820_64125 [Minicystis sp.]